MHAVQVQYVMRRRGVLLGWCGATARSCSPAYLWRLAWSCRTRCLGRARRRAHRDPTELAHHTFVLYSGHLSV